MVCQGVVDLDNESVSQKTGLEFKDARKSYFE